MQAAASEWLEKAEGDYITAQREYGAPLRQVGPRCVNELRRGFVSRSRPGRAGIEVRVSNMDGQDAQDKKEIRFTTRLRLEARKHGEE